MSSLRSTTWRMRSRSDSGRKAGLPVTIPVIVCSADSADTAFKAHAALLEAEARDPALRLNPYWTMLRQDAYERFASAFAKVG